MTAKEGTSMERTITLLREKNHYLEKFYEVNDRELTKFESGNFDQIENFYCTRDKILDLIRLIDDLIREENDKEPEFQMNCTSEQRAEVEAMLKDKEEWVTKILVQDLEVLSWIEKEKSNIIRELQSVRKGRKAMQGYHSGDYRNQLDEKA
jgi:hypothetical protein